MCLLQEYSALHALKDLYRPKLTALAVRSATRFAAGVAILIENLNENAEGSKTWKGARPAKPNSVCLPCLVPL